MIHLHTRSRYSLLEAVLDIDDIIRLAKEHGQKKVVLSDHRSMFATMQFFHAAKAADLQPVVALEFEIEFADQTFMLMLIAANSTGLKNLYELSSKLMSNSDAVSLEELSAYTQGNILLTAGADDALEALACEERADELDEFMQALLQVSDENYPVYAAMSLHDSPVYRSRDVILKERAKENGLKTVAISRIEYERPEQEFTLRVLQAIKLQKNVSDPTIPVRSGRFWRSEDEMRELYDEDDLQASDEIANMIEPYEMEKGSLPQFANKAGVSSDEYLRNLCMAGLKKRLNGRLRADYVERLNHELDVILSMGFADYFLIVWDFIREARSRDILVGPGRGSAAGSLVAWVLGIAHVDPIASGLLFERFLNPERISMPDIDTDFPDNRRDEIISYVQDVYGRNHVAHIVTFSRLKAKAALRDCARAMGMHIREVEKLTALVPSTPGTTLKQAKEESRAFSSLLANSASLRRVYEVACTIENFPRHTSVHAGGIVLAREELTNYAPLWDAGAALPAVQFTMEYLEEIGLIKFDFLALRNLTMIDEMCASIREQSGQKLELLRLPLNDPAVYQMLSRGDTLGVFQLESAGIRKLIMRFKPQRFEDIAAVLALYRPGPMKSIDTYLNARFHPERRQSIHPLIDGLLAETGGIFLYQEQIMEAARILGGFSLAQADILRKAMSKKKHDVMEEWKARFVQGAAQKGIPDNQAQHIFGIMEQFADYGFNKSHSYAYGLIVYQMAYLKVHYPLAFYECLLNYSAGSGSKTYSIIQEAARRRIRILPVSINRSGTRYTLENGALRMPLTLMKSFGRMVVEKIIAEREAYGPFDDPVIAVLRLARLKLSREQILMLIQIGAFDETGCSRESLEGSFDEMMRLIDLAILDEQSKRWKLAGVSAPVIERKPVERSARLEHEKAILGFTLGPHPAREARKRDSSLSSIEQISDRTGSVRTCGIITRIREHKTKKGDMMAFATLSDESAQIDLAIMPKTYARIQERVKEKMLVEVEGKKDDARSIAVFELHLLRV